MNYGKSNLYCESDPEKLNDVNKFEIFFPKQDASGTLKKKEKPVRLEHKRKILCCLFKAPVWEFMDIGRCPILFRRVSTKVERSEIPFPAKSGQVATGQVSAEVCQRRKLLYIRLSAY